MPKISIIMPAYNSGKYISDAIESVLSQTFKDWELIIIDDGSTDITPELARKYAMRDKRIKVVSQQNTGTVTARNNGIMAARGKYIFPLDADDKIAPECLRRLYDIITTTNYSIICPNGSFFGCRTDAFFLEKPTRINMYSANRLHNSSLYEKKLWKKYGGYDNKFDRGFEDYDFWLNFFDDGKKAVRTKEQLFFYRIKEDSRNIQSKKHTKEIFADLRRKHQRMKLYRPLYKFIKLFYHDGASPKTGTRRIRILHIPVYAKGKLK